MISSRFAITCAFALSATAACTDTESATNLNPDGPPMIEQVRLSEAVFDNMGLESDVRVFAFGTLPGLTAADEHDVSTAAVNGQHLRIIFDEILRGNHLEEIQCRANVSPDDGAFTRIPDGTTPDDIAKCAVAKDVLKASCKGDHAVCICEIPTGCLVGTDMVAMGDPVGVQDVNADGASDYHQFISTAVQLVCGSVTISADPAKSYWNPSGDQQIPAVGGAEALGPAVVWYPKAQMNGATLPTSTTCSLKFADDVVDKSDIPVCAPQGGRTPECSGNLDRCTQTCTPGDVSAFSFKTAPLSVSVSGLQLGVELTQPFELEASAVVDPATLTGAITVQQAGSPFTGYTVTSTNSAGKTKISLSATAAGGWAPDTDYIVTVSTALKDTFGQPLPAPFSATFHTGA